MTDPQSAAASAARYLALVEESTRNLLQTVSELKPEAVAEPSALPGWTRGHVLAHIARNADSLVNLLNGARTGTDIPQYASNEVRDQDIERDAPRPVDVHLADLEASHERFAAAAALLPAEAWTADVRHRTGYVFPASDIPWKRLAEVAYHHVDLDAGYTPAQWPEAFAVTEFRRLATKLAGTDLPAVELIADDTDDRGLIGTGENALTVQGPVRTLLAWLSGRSDGEGLRRTPGTALPQLPPLG
ncbi:maleylpyruvate isomerase family mycothiol-dependent enzyme [Streptomyces kaniharaensis]|uniref:Maleylpyruvate isomerase family mycothiol-dependent enzyme n=1 Tax=Streptomyces kaniharaensis TaxID=212423 RepID=A0A6N7KV13_9ACTN|nr:maleylpyruvate isomerase family mycothiol-dependent enzyme [Streptomyces kaniharaensis]MQS14429.1 maleylpyruvate isomerase family mycothiol-dependent enzyme [Streptomyces kaniharaensis]